MQIIASQLDHTRTFFTLKARLCGPFFLCTGKNVHCDIERRFITKCIPFVAYRDAMWHWFVKVFFFILVLFLRYFSLLFVFSDYCCNIYNYFVWIIMITVSQSKTQIRITIIESIANDSNKRNGEYGKKYASK